MMMITADMATMTMVALAGVPQRELAPTPRGPRASRDSAYINRAAPTVEARQQPNALTVVPSVITSPTQWPTYEAPRSPSSDGEATKFLTPAALVPNPIISTAVTTVKYTPPNTATPRIARGMSRVGRLASSPRVAAASKPANDKKPNTTPRNRSLGPVPGATVNTLNVKCSCPGAFPASSRTSTTTVTIRISATVVPSTDSRMLAPRLAGMMARNSVSARATATRIHGAQVGGFGQAPTSCRNAVPKMPAALAVTTA